MLADFCEMAVSKEKKEARKLERICVFVCERDCNKERFLVGPTRAKKIVPDSNSQIGVVGRLKQMTLRICRKSCPAGVAPYTYLRSTLADCQILLTVISIPIVRNGLLATIVPHINLIYIRLSAQAQS